MTGGGAGPARERAGGGRAELAILIGLQASGKSTFHRTRLAATHAWVSKDRMRGARHKQTRQMARVEELLAAGRDVSVDNTNPSPAEWEPLVAAGRRHGAAVVGYWFPPDLAGSRVRNAARTGKNRVPDVALRATIGRLRRPTPADGFDTLYEVAFDGRGGFTVRPFGAADGPLAATAEEEDGSGDGSAAGGARG